MIIDRTDSTDAGVTLNQVGMDEAQRILKLLEAAIVKSRRSRRDIERKLGWSQGYLGSLLRGRIALKVWHVFALSRELGIEPLSFFLTVAPPRDPGWILQQLGIEPPPKPPEKAAPKEEAVPIDREELEEMMQKLLYDELSRLGLLDADRGPEPDSEPDSDLS
jgi:hypothetical protein